MIDVDYPNLLKLFPEYLDPKRSESASFLIWYLENYYRLDGIEAVDSVCDQKGDKGVWPAPGSEDTELGVLMEREVRHGEAEVYAGVQA